VTRRRFMAGVLSVSVLTLCALLLPSLHRSGKQESQPAKDTGLPITAAPPALPAAPLVAEAAPRTAAAQSTPAKPAIDPHKAMGSKNAPITLEIFSDYQCPACRALYMSVWRQLVDDYANTGKVYLVSRDFPLPMHAYSRIAAQYANAAARLGKFEGVERVLFERQSIWEASGDVDGTVASVLTPAEMVKVRALVKGGTLEDGIQKDIALGQFYRVTQTPTSIITCKGQTYPVVGGQSYAVFHEFLDQLLKN
jgi:protein-disulfide isomerase